MLLKEHVITLNLSKAPVINEVSEGFVSNLSGVCMGKLDLSS